MARAMAELRACWDAHPCTSDMAGSSSQTATITPSTPAIAPTTRSTCRIGPMGMRAWKLAPASSPKAWPTNPAPMSVAATISSLLPDGDPRRASTTSGRKWAAMARPSTRPIHDAALATNPSRNPPTTADTANTMMRRSRMSTGCRCLRSQQAGRGEEPGVTDHAVVRADRLALDVPRALQHLDCLGHGERAPGQLLAQLGDLADG